MKQIILWLEIILVAELANGDLIPADAVIISTSEPLGTCHIDTHELTFFNKYKHTNIQHLHTELITFNIYIITY